MQLSSEHHNDNHTDRKLLPSGGDRLTHVQHRGQHLDVSPLEEHRELIQSYRNMTLHLIPAIPNVFFLYINIYLT